MLTPNFLFYFVRC